MAESNCIAKGNREFTERAASIENPEHLITWLRGLVTEWSEKQDKVFCVACAGYALAHGDEHPVEGGVFSSIADELGDTELSSYLEAGLDRMEELLKAGREGASHG